MNGMAVFFSVMAGIFVFIIFISYGIRMYSARYVVHNRVQGLQVIDIMSAGRRQRRQSLRDSFRQIGHWIMTFIGNRVKTMTPLALYQALERRIMWAGKQYIWDAGTFFFVMVCCGLLLCILSLGVVVKGQFQLGQRIVVLLLMFFSGAFIPWFCLSVMVTRRRQGIIAQLSDIMDLVCISVQAGLSFDAALARVGRRMKGPMVEESNRMLHDIRMGMPRREALTYMAQRCDVSSVYMFVAAVIQSESLGSSMSHTLQIQADNIRERHRQNVRERAMKLPVKLIFPLAIFIFPTIFIVILGPVILSMMTQGKGFL